MLEAFRQDYDPGSPSGIQILCRTFLRDCLKAFPPSHRIKLAASLRSYLALILWLIEIASLKSRTELSVIHRRGRKVISASNPLRRSSLNERCICKIKQLISISNSCQCAHVSSQHLAHRSQMLPLDCFLKFNSYRNFSILFREAQLWNESQLQQWAKAAAQREADNLALLQYQRQDETLIKQLNKELER